MPDLHNNYVALHGMLETLCEGSLEQCLTAIELESKKQSSLVAIKSRRNEDGSQKMHPGFVFPDNSTNN